MIGYVSRQDFSGACGGAFLRQYGGVGGGSISGIATGIIFSLSSVSLSYIAGAYALGATDPGLFFPFGQDRRGAAFIYPTA